MRLACGLLVLAACGHRAPAPGRGTGVPWATSGVDWSSPPAVTTPARVIAPAMSELVLPSGVRVVLVENHRLPTVAITAIVTSAGSREDGESHGIAAVTADLLDEGAGPRDADELADALELAGARLEIAIATDHASVHVTALSDHLADTLALLADVLRRPRFADADSVRLSATRAVELAEHHARPRTIAAQVFDRVAFGDHPYAYPAEGTPGGVVHVYPDAVRAFYRRAYTPAATTLVVVGDVTRALLERQLAQTFGDWTGPAAPVTRAPALPRFEPVLAVVDSPGAHEAVVLVGGRAAPAGDPGAAAVELANAVLGGTGPSRLDRELRVQRGLTTGASSSAWRGAWAGSWTAAATFPTAKTSEGLHAELALIAAIGATPIAADELERARASLLRAFAGSFETTVGTARVIERSVASGQPVSAVATLPDRIAAVTSASARDAMAPIVRDLAIVVVGDWASLGDDLAKLGLPVVHYTADATIAR